MLWVKGSGGDLGTLTEKGLAVLRLDRMRSLVDVYPGVEREDEMVAAFDYCLHGRGGAAPSIDTAMHGLVDAAHVDHLHPDSGIALATAADGEALTKQIFGDRVVWIPWRRPGFQLGLDIADIKHRNPQAIGTILGGHGITAWGDTSAEAEARSLEIIDTAERYIDTNGKSQPFGPPLAGYEAAAGGATPQPRLPQLAPFIRGLASADKPQVGHFTDDPRVLEFLSASEHPRLAALGPAARTTSCAPRSSRWCSTCPPTHPSTTPRHDWPSCTSPTAPTTRRTTTGMPATTARASEARTPPSSSFLASECSATARTSRPRGWRASSTSTPSTSCAAPSRSPPTPPSTKPRSSASNTGRWKRPSWLVCASPSRWRPGSHWSPAPPPASARPSPPRLAAEGACVVIADLDPEKAAAAAEEIGTADVAVGIAADVTDEEAVQAAIDATVLAFGGIDIVVNNAGLSLSKSLLETTAADWDLQHNVMARGSFLVSKAAARALIDQKLGGDIIYISSKNSVFAGPNNIAYSATKADQAHQVRLLAAELGEHGVKVNGINPDGVVRGSGIFAGGWGAKRAAVYGVDEEDLGKFYAQRTLLKREVLPENIANAAFALCTSDFSHTTGLHVPVDAGVAAAFLR